MKNIGFQSSRLKGFTLIEIILVVLILAVIAGLTIPNFSPTYKKFQLKQAAEDLTYIMRYAQSRAIMKNKQIRLQFDSDFKSYYLSEKVDISSERGETPEEESAAFERFTGRLGRIYHIPEIVEVETESQSIDFYTDGTIQKEYIYICKEEDCYTITTKEQRGTVRLVDTRLDEVVEDEE